MILSVLLLIKEYEFSNVITNGIINNNTMNTNFIENIKENISFNKQKILVNN